MEQNLKDQLTQLRNSFYDQMPLSGEITAWDMITWAKEMFKQFDAFIDEEQETVPIDRKQQFYELGQSMGISINDLQRLRYAWKQEYADSAPSGQIAGVWMKASASLPPVGIYNALYNGDHIIFQVHDGGFRIIFYDKGFNDLPNLNLIKWLDESVSSIPAGSKERELIELLDEYIKLLNKEINDLIGMASIHGWSSRNVQEGIELRAKIEEARKKYSESLNKQQP